MPTQMAATGDGRETKRVCASATTAVQQCWSSTFPDDLLAVIYHLVASPRGRVRIAAVCRSWRAAARAALPAAALPWMLLSPWDTDMMKKLHCPEDGDIVHVPLPGRMELVGCHDGGWIATYMLGSLRIVNILSGAEVKLGENREMLVCGNFRQRVLHPILKVVFSESPTSGDCILAAMSDNHLMWPCIGLCRVGCKSNNWTVQRSPGFGRPFVDITFCNSKLYGLTKKELVEFQVDVNEDGAPVVIAHRQLAVTSIGHCGHGNFYHEDYVTYIFDLQGKLAMARRTLWSRNEPPFFKVFVLADIHADEVTTPSYTYTHKWVEVTDLDDHALFLGRTFSKAVHVPANMPGSVERNHIYFAHHRCLSRYSAIPGPAISLAISNETGDHTYYMEDDGQSDITDDELKRISSVGYFTKGINSHGDMWVLPPAR